MLSLDSPRWKELRHAYGSAEHVPALIRAMASEVEPSFSDHPAKARNNPTPWDEVYSSLCHQYSVYSATYAAFPHIVEIAEADGLAKRLPTLLLAGTIRVYGELESDVPEDLLEDFEAAIAKVRRWSLSIVRQAKLNYPGDLPSLIQAFGGVRYPRSAYVHVLDRFYEGEWEVEIDSCPSCARYIVVEMGDDGPIAMPTDSRGLPIREHGKRSVPDRSRYLERIAHGHGILREAADPSWGEAETGAVLAALATERNDPVLATRLLDIEATVTCPHCGCSFMLADKVETLWMTEPRPRPKPWNSGILGLLIRRSEEPRI